MSTYSEIRTQFTDPELLIEALKSMGLTKVENHIGKPVYLEGYSKRDMVDIVASKADHLGFRQNADGTFSVVCEISDQRKYGTGSKWEKDVKFNYAQQNILRTARQQGLRVLHTGKKLANGKVEYKFLAA